MSSTALVVGIAGLLIVAGLLVAMIGILVGDNLRAEIEEEVRLQRLEDALARRKDRRGDR